MPLTQSAYCRAYQYLNQIAEKLASNSEDTFPAIRALAAGAGMSTLPILHAIKQLKAEGKIMVTGKGRAARIKRANSPIDYSPLKKADTIVNASREYRWEILRRLISEDVLNGTYKENQKLPSFKELHLRFGDCYRTIARALRACCESGLIRESGNRYVVTPLARPSHTTIYMLVHDIFLPAHFNIQDERHRDFLRLIEVECKNRSLNLKIVGLNCFSDPAFARDFKNNALGAIVWGTFLEGKTFLNDLISFGRQIAIVDEPENCRVLIAGHHRTHHNVRFFLPGSSETAAKNVGKMLLRFGHRRVAFISMYETEQFSTRRLEGLRAAYDAAGLRNGVAAFISNVNEANPQKSFADRPAWDNLCASAQNFIPLNSVKHYAEKLLFTMQTMAAEEKYRQCCLPLFENALADPSLTAWVCVNDQVAYLAIDFLDARDLHVPADLSLVGFDDLFRSFQSNLTSYNFNNPMLVNRIFQYFLTPLSDKITVKRGPVEIPGHIMERGSVNKARIAP
ncbi:MAG: substrate-binding domain-containing protein [Chitinivibrionales bacterium]|nr:substrate-binding domain-containing protein [Chitinivibrionales bacterium]